MHQILSEYGVVAVAVAGAEAAISVLTSNTSVPFDLLISHIGMPETDGYALIQQIRALAPERGRLPALALTAYAREEDRQAAFAAGFQAHLAKPVDPTKLISAIAQLTGCPTVT